MDKQQYLTVAGDKVANASCSASKTMCKAAMCHFSGKPHLFRMSTSSHNAFFTCFRLCLYQIFTAKTTTELFIPQLEVWDLWIPQDPTSLGFSSCCSQHYRLSPFCATLHWKERDHGVQGNFSMTGVLYILEPILAVYSNKGEKLTRRSECNHILPPSACKVFWQAGFQRQTEQCILSSLPQRPEYY